MAIPSRQIGWSTTDNLLWQISKQLEYLTQVIAHPPASTTTTTTAPSYSYYLGSPCSGGANVTIRSTTTLTNDDVIYHSNANCCTIIGPTAGPTYDADFISFETCFVAPCP